VIDGKSILGPLIIVEHWSFLLVSAIWEHWRQYFSSSFSFFLNFFKFSISIFILIVINTFLKKLWRQNIFMWRTIITVYLIFLGLVLNWGIIHFLWLLDKILYTILFNLLRSCSTNSLMVSYIIWGLRLRRSICLGEKRLNGGVAYDWLLFLNRNFIWIVIVVIGSLRFIWFERTH
jgi:hypothetical protein